LEFIDISYKAGNLIMNEKSQNNKVQKPKGHFFRYFFKFLLLICAVGVIFVIGSLPSKQTSVPPAEAAPPNVTVAIIAAEPKFADTFELPAVIEPNRVVTISAEISGSIDSIPVTKGQKLEAGDLLIRLNSDLIRPQVAVAKAQLDRDQIQFERMKKLVEGDATSRSDLDDATTKLAVSKATLENVTVQLERSSIFAPIGGMLNSLPVEKGEYVLPGTPVVEIVEVDYVKVAVDIPEKDVSFLSESGKAEILFEYKGQPATATGTISFLSKLADSLTRSVRMEITVNNSQGHLHSGQIVRVQLTRRVIDNAILIPLSAVIPLEEGNAVYIVDSSDQAVRKEVSLGVIKGENIQITRGVKQGDKLIVAGHRFVSPGQKVKIITESTQNSK
jgi:membrane fusion protein, multidrug efflux system